MKDSTEQPKTDQQPQQDSSNTSEKKSETVESPSKEEPKKKKVKRSDLGFTFSTSSFNDKDIVKYTDLEAQLTAADRLVFETSEKKNAVESYVLDMRRKLDSLSGFITEQDKQKFLDQLQNTEDWLYSEAGEDQTKSVYAAKLTELRAVGDPVVRRKIEADSRYQVIKDLKTSITNHKLTATSMDPKYEHIPNEEKQKIVQKCDQLEIELNTLLGKQESLPKHQDPILTIADLEKKRQELDSFASSIMNKPKPPPPKKEEPKKEEPKKEEPKKEEQNSSNNQQENNNNNNTTNNNNPADQKNNTQQQTENKGKKSKDGQESSEMDLD